MATRRAASSRKPTPHTAVMTRKMCRKPSYCQRLIISRPLAVSGPMNSTARPYISGRRVHSEPRQPSPLRRLEAKGLVKALDGTGESARHRRVYEPTKAGRAAHETWLRTPVDVSTVARDLGLHLMRFVMMEHASSREEVLSYLGNLKDALAAFTAGLERYAGATAQLGDRHPGLALPVCHGGDGRERGGQRGAGSGFQQVSLAGDGGVPLRRERGLEFVEQPVEAPDHLRRVGAVPDDLGQREHQQSVKGAQLPLEPDRSAGIHSQAGRVEPTARDGQEVADAVDGLDPGRGVIDGRGQRADRDVNELPEAERRILHESALAADEEEPGHVAVAEVPAVHQRDRGAVSQVLPYSYGQLEPALILPAQFGQTVQVGG